MSALVFVRTDRPQAQHDEVFHEADCPKLAQVNLAPGAYTAIPRRFAEAVARPCERCET
jgi:hypothetical protein